ncbi:YTH domain-containing protein 1-like [Columba livia]|uniref:YTH domain-containing protein 1-like n=1 Tax=Columba livia TaxID=8932 RepID=UPI0031BBA5CB
MPKRTKHGILRMQVTPHCAGGWRASCCVGDEKVEEMEVDGNIDEDMEVDQQVEIDEDMEVDEEVDEEMEVDGEVLEEMEVDG